jgi:dihydroorotate dehydrogenase (fumarate)
MTLLALAGRDAQRQSFGRSNAMDLTTNYMGLELTNPLVASASPLNAELDNIRLLEDAGVAAIVLPSLFEEQIEAEMRRYETLTAAGLESSPEAQSYFPESDKPGPHQYLDLIQRAVAAVEIPVIGSLNGTTDEGWTGYARLIEEAGASALELNVYFIPTDLSLTGREVEQRYLDILRQVRETIDIPVAIKIGPYFSSVGQIAMEFAGAGADALVLFNRFYQPDVDLAQLRLLNDLQLSTASEIRLPLLWIAVLSGRIDASLAASSGVENSEQILKYLLAGADVVMTTSALLRHGPTYVEKLLNGVRSWLSARDIESVDQIRGLLSQHNFRNRDSFGRANYIKILHGYGNVDRVD